MINAAIVGLGRWGQNLVNSVQGKSDKIRFVAGVLRHPENRLGDQIATEGKARHRAVRVWCMDGL